MRVLISAETIASRIRSLSDEVSQQFDGARPVIAVIVLRGAAIFAADLLRQLRLDVRAEYVYAESYRGTRGGDVHLSPLPDVRGAQVLVIEDIVERGETLRCVAGVLREAGASSVVAVALLRKPDRLTSEIPCPVLAGFDIGPEFVVGYGMDFDGQHRNLPDVCVYED